MKIIALLPFLLLTACAGNIQSADLKPGDVGLTNSGETAFMLTSDGWSGKHPAPTAYAASATDSGYDMYGSTPFGGTFVSGQSVSMIDTKNLSGSGLKIVYGEDGRMESFELSEFDANASEPIEATVALVGSIIEYLKAVPAEQRTVAIAQIEATGEFLGKVVSPEMLSLIKAAFGLGV